MDVTKVPEGKLPKNPYFISPPPVRIRHPLEENIIASLVVTLLAVAVAVVVGVPFLIFTGVLLIFAFCLRYTLLTIHSIGVALGFLCANRLRNTPANRTPPSLLPRDRLAPGNDIRWVGTRSQDNPQPLIQTLLLFEGTMQLAQLRSLIASRVLVATESGHLLYPKLTQSLRPRLGGYIWEADPDFAIQNHIVSAPNSIVTEEHVQDWMGRLILEPLHLGRPLWEMHILAPYGSGKDTIILVRTHMSLVDGASLIRILVDSLADRQSFQPSQKTAFGEAAFSFNLLRSFIVGPLTLAIWLLSTPKDKNSITYVAPKKQQQSSIVNCRNFGSPWKMAWSAGLSIAKVSRVKQIMRSSFNDVLLSATAGSLRKLLQSQGITYPPNLKAVVPVDLRSTSPGLKRRKRLGWKAASVLTQLPTGLEGAIPRLWSTRQRLDEIKASADPVVAYGTTAIIMNLLPQSLGGAFLDSITNKASVQIASAHGPERVISLGGFVLKGIYPFLPPPGDLRLSVTLFSYADQVHVTALAHPALKEAPSVVLKGINLQVEQLSRQLSQRKVPGESRRLNRPMTVIPNIGENIQKPPLHQIHVKLQVVQEELQLLTSDTESEASPHFRTRLNSLKNDYQELMGELKRRSSIVDGYAVSFEDEEDEENFRKPRKRALSVSVSRRGSLYPPPRPIQISDSTQSFHSESPSPLLQSRNSTSIRSPIKTTAV